MLEVSWVSDPIWSGSAFPLNEKWGNLLSKKWYGGRGTLQICMEKVWYHDARLTSLTLTWFSQVFFQTEFVLFLLALTRFAREADMLGLLGCFVICFTCIAAKAIDRISLFLVWSGVRHEYVPPQV